MTSLADSHGGHLAQPEPRSFPNRTAPEYRHFAGNLHASCLGDSIRSIIYEQPFLVRCSQEMNED